MEKEKYSFIKERKRKILIIEDNELNREILTSILEEQFDFLYAENGKLGLEILTAHYNELSVVLLDVYMPVMTGFEFLEIIQKDEILNKVPVIVTTGSQDPKNEAKSLSLGAVDFVTKPYNPEVVRGRVNSVIKLRESMATLSAVEFDSLTGLYNISAFTHKVNEILRLNPEEAFDMSVADIQDFKLINSVFGNSKGDDILKHYADCLKKAVPNSIIARNGDKFFIFSPSDFRIYDSEEEKIVSFKDSLIPNVIINYGLYYDVDKTKSVTVLMDRAMMAVQSIKHDFTKRVAFYDSKMESKLLFNQKLESEFDDAIKNKEFKVWYQPKVNVNSGKLVAAEALVRWIKEDGKMIYPSDFIPLFESDGLIRRLDEYVFRTVCEFLRDRMENDLPIVPISVNLSRNSMYQKDTAKRYFEIIEETGVNPSFVPIELTESAATEGPLVKEITDAFISSGFSIHMDDFGTGYSSLSGLTTLSIDVIKLDKSLIDRVGSSKGATIVKHVIDIAHESGMMVVAEGVEEKSQVIFLSDVCCDMIQGYYFSPPKKQQDFVTLLDQAESINLDLEYQKMEIYARTTFEITDDTLSAIKRIADDMLEGFVIYKANSEETLIYANQTMIDMMGCLNLSDLRQFTKNSFKGIVSKEDYEKTAKEIMNPMNSSILLNYHITKKDLSQVMVKNRGVCVHTSNYGNVYYLFIKEI